MQEIGRGGIAAGAAGIVYVDLKQLMGADGAGIALRE
jgi:hypothetical protein